MDTDWLQFKIYLFIYLFNCLFIYLFIYAKIQNYVMMPSPIAHIRNQSFWSTHTTQNHVWRQARCLKIWRILNWEMNSKVKDDLENEDNLKTSVAILGWTLEHGSQEVYKLKRNFWESKFIHIWQGEGVNFPYKKWSLVIRIDFL